MRYVVALTGSSGIAYGIRLLEVLKGERILVMSRTAERLAEEEIGRRPDELKGLADRHFDDGDLFAPISSGSYPIDGMIIVPCSLSTVSKIAHGIGDTLITRAAAVALKERRKLVLVPRETPVSTIMLENMTTLSRAGAVILPACPGFY
ncbi:MAG: UbiX family flavin prenyltransferase, partial [Methanomassiliicoccales archaeon]